MATISSSLSGMYLNLSSFRSMPYFAFSETPRLPMYRISRSLNCSVLLIVRLNRVSISKRFISRMLLIWVIWKCLSFRNAFSSISFSFIFARPWFFSSSPEMLSSNFETFTFSSINCCIPSMISPAAMNAAPHTTSLFASNITATTIIPATSRYRLSPVNVKIDFFISSGFCRYVPCAGR